MRSIFLEIRHNPSLLWAFVQRAIAEENKGSYLGWIWNLLGPVVQFAIYFTVFGIIFGGRYPESSEKYASLEYAIGIFISLSLFRFFSEMISSSPKLITKNPNFIKKVVFPLSLIPIIQTAQSLFNLSINLAIGIIAIMFTPVDPGLSAWSFLAILPPFVFMILGISYFLSALGVFFKDLTKVIDNGIIIFLYASAVFYSSAMVKEKGAVYWEFLKWNPLLHFVESTRKILIWGELPSLTSLLALYLVAGLSFFVGTTIFNRSRRSFSDFV